MDGLNASRRTWLIGLGAVGLWPSRAWADIPRVQRIGKRVRPALVEQYAAAGMSYPPKQLLLRVFKHERELQVWASDTADGPVSLLETVQVCAASGELGPKRRQGDEQVPEGIYKIHRYNGWSGFHLSLRVNYPNASDRVRGRRGNLGGAIMVHGGCASIGCVAIENDPIERVFLAALDSNRASKRRPVIHMFPTRFDEAGWKRLRASARAAGETHGTRCMTLWRELAEIDAAFEETKRIVAVSIDPKTGSYALSEPAT